MKSLRESLLGDLEDNLANGDKDMIESMNIPTVKDFEKYAYNRDMCYVDWFYPNLSELLKKYPKINTNNYNAIRFILNNGFKHSCLLNIGLTNNPKTLFGQSTTNHLYGWSSAFSWSNLRTYKKMTINIIDKLAKNPALLDEVLKHANYCQDFAERDEYSKYKNKNLYDIIRK